MKITFRSYAESDFLKVRDFLIDTQTKLGRPNCWAIDRWEFLDFFQEVGQASSKQRWQDRIGLWEYSNGDIAAVACDDGNAFFLLDTLEPATELINEMFQYAEEYLLKFDSGVSSNHLEIVTGMTTVEQVAMSRGYVREEWSNPTLSISMDREFKVTLPDGFALQCGSKVDDLCKAMGHIMAFDYADSPSAELTLKNYGNIKNAPDYNPELDLCIINESGEVVSFCGIWLDEVNQVAILEPVGTHKDYRRRGLGKTVIYEGFNRLKGLGVVKVYVGSDQPFYRRIGFEPEFTTHSWRKHME
ncbi:GNAT family N-acetyltransferase [Paenibacillus segetis]|uniref:N-acetyltransferase domain-containing protein n=1 Tax=Paenibacillus segetis TaxID=1325360 RepID=A0ABQ1Y6C3_9BACL|nr:GNAT family N-acetyltransferase [Paenibacillus segetis]GGH13037.1 hypothetical protein GCM10008013_05820 [Paenibacillus segetis]